MFSFIFWDYNLNKKLFLSIWNHKKYKKTFFICFVFFSFEKLHWKSTNKNHTKFHVKFNEKREKEKTHTLFEAMAKWINLRFHFWGCATFINLKKKISSKMREIKSHKKSHKWKWKFSIKNVIYNLKPN